MKSQFDFHPGMNQLDKLKLAYGNWQNHLRGWKLPPLTCREKNRMNPLAILEYERAKTQSER